MKKLLYAFRFLTILPIPWKQDEDLTAVGRSVIFFPLVGLIIGLVLSLLVNVVMPFFTPLTIAGIIIFLWIFFTGGLHLDGLSDLFDGLGGKSREDSLRIMKDSNIGAFGGLSLIAIILLKIIFLRELIIKSDEILLFALILAPAWARMMQLLVIRFYKSARPDGMGNFFKKEIREREWIIPLILILILTIYLFSVSSLIFLAIYLLIIWFVSQKISKRLGGLTGDCYGAICEISEMLFLLLFAL